MHRGQSFPPARAGVSYAPQTHGIRVRSRLPNRRGEVGEILQAALRSYLAWGQCGKPQAVAAFTNAGDPGSIVSGSAMTTPPRSITAL